MTDDDKHRALDPAIAEQAGEVVKRLTDEHVAASRTEAADLISVLLAQNAALRAERDALIEWNGQASVRAESAEDRAEAAEAKVEGLRGAGSNLVAQLYQMWTEARDHRDRSDLGSAEYAKRDMVASAFRGAYLAALSATTEEGHE